MFHLVVSAHSPPTPSTSAQQFTNPEFLGFLTHSSLPLNQKALCYNFDILSTALDNDYSVLGHILTQFKKVLSLPVLLLTLYHVSSSLPGLNL